MRVHEEWKQKTAASIHPSVHSYDTCSRKNSLIMPHLIYVRIYMKILLQYVRERARGRPLRVMRINHSWCRYRGSPCRWKGRADTTTLVLFASSTIDRERDVSIMQCIIGYTHSSMYIYIYTSVPYTRTYAYSLTTVPRCSAIVLHLYHLLLSLLPGWCCLVTNRTRSDEGLPHCLSLIFNNTWPHLWCIEIVTIDKHFRLQVSEGHLLIRLGRKRPGRLEGARKTKSNLRANQPVRHIEPYPRMAVIIILGAHDHAYYWGAVLCMQCIPGRASTKTLSQQGESYKRSHLLHVSDSIKIMCCRATRTHRSTNKKVFTSKRVFIFRGVEYYIQNRYRRMNY